MFERRTPFYCSNELPEAGHGKREGNDGRALRRQPKKLPPLGTTRKRFASPSRPGTGRFDPLPTFDPAYEFQGACNAGLSRKPLECVDHTHQQLVPKTLGVRLKLPKAQYLKPLVFEPAQCAPKGARPG